MIQGITNAHRSYMISIFWALMASGKPETPLPEHTKQQPIHKVSSKVSTQAILDKLRPSVVMIKVKSPFNGDSARWWSGGLAEAWEATGFLVDKQRGLIATNKHVTGENAVCTYELHFADGSTANAQFVYADPLYDFAFLAVDPKVLPEDSKAITFSDEPIRINETIYSIGNAWGENFSILKGSVISLYENIGPFAEQSCKFSAITVGGVSGSPIVDVDNKLKGIIYGGRFITGIFLPSSYLKPALHALQQDKKPMRKTIGLVSRYVDLRKILETGLISKDAFAEYNKAFPDAHNKILMTSMVSKDSPSAGQLQPDDIIWSINKKLIGPRMQYLDEIINVQDDIELGIFREGKLLTFKMTCQALPEIKKKLLSFAGAIFVEQNIGDQILSNLKNKGVFLNNVQRTSEFNKIRGEEQWGSTLIQITSINDHTIKTLEDLQAIIPKLLDQKLLKVRYIHHGDRVVFGERYDRTHYERVDFIKYDKEFDAPKYLEFRGKEWHAKDIKV